MQVVYAGMRAWLMETGLLLQATDLSDPRGSESVRRSLSDLLRVEAALATAEEETLFQLLLDQAPYLVCQFEQEHRRIAQLRSEVAVMVQMLSHYPSNEQVARLRLAYTSYMAFVLQHGMREESILAGSEMADLKEGGSAFVGQALLSGLGAESCSGLLGRILAGMDREQRTHIWNGIAAWGPEFRKALMLQEPGTTNKAVQRSGRLTVAA
jgi:hypothetical protein